MHVCTCCNEFIRLVHIAIKIAPDERWFTINLARTELELFANQKAFLIVYDASELDGARQDTRIYTRF